MALLGARRVAFMVLLALIMLQNLQANGAIPKDTQKLIHKANSNGSYLGLVIPNPYEMNPLLQHPNFTSTNFTIDFAGRRFRFGVIGEKNVILVTAGLSMINAGITTQLLLALFNIEGVVHLGIAGNANPNLNIGDVTIPQFWAHSGLWVWQRYGDGPEDILPFEPDDYTREIGSLRFANYTVNVTHSSSHDNTLNNIWYQLEEIYPVHGTPETIEHVFWISVNPYYFNLSKSLEELKLEGCVNATTCLSETPKVVTVHRGTSASIYLDNAAYRNFLYGKFNVSPVDMETASVALMCHQHNIPFIAMRALSDLAGGGSAQSNEASTFTSLAAKNSVTVVIAFIEKLSIKD